MRVPVVKTVYGALRDVTKLVNTSGRKSELERVVLVGFGPGRVMGFVTQEHAILPGIGMGARALNRYTAMLPLMEAPGIAASPPAPVGRNTIAAMTSGLYWGHVGAVCELARRMVQADPGDPPRLMLVTGGAGAVVSPHLDRSQEWPFLPLQGLILAYLAGNSA